MRGERGWEAEGRADRLAAARGAAARRARRGSKSRGWGEREVGFAHPASTASHENTSRRLASEISSTRYSWIVPSLNFTVRTPPTATALASAPAESTSELQDSESGRTRAHTASAGEEMTLLSIDVAIDFEATMLRRQLSQAVDDSDEEETMLRRHTAIANGWGIDLKYGRVQVQFT